MTSRSDDTTILRVSLLQLQACSTMKDIEQLTGEVNYLNLCGTTNGWSFDERPEVAPVQCGDDPKRKHYVFCC